MIKIFFDFEFFSLQNEQDRFGKGKSRKNFSNPFFILANYTEKAKYYTILFWPSYAHIYKDLN